jgi:drug/metabolite transporter (DMT)-like permease
MAGLFLYCRSHVLLGRRRHLWQSHLQWQLVCRALADFSRSAYADADHLRCSGALPHPVAALWPPYLLLCALVGTLGVACSNYFYYLAVQKSTVALAITVQYIAPVWVLLYMVGRGRERATLQKAAAALVAMIGTALAIGVFQSGVKFSLLAVSAALLASFGYSFYNIAGQGLVARNHQFTVMFYILLSSALMWLFVDPPWRVLAQHYSGTQWQFLFAFACLSMVLPYMLYLSGLKYLDPTRAVITSCLEPVFAILFAWVFVHEGLRPLQVTGIVAVLVATVMVQARPRAAPMAATS